MEFVTLLARFKGVEEHADGGYSALCPAHNDSDPSLRIWRGDDLKVRLTCRAGCRTGDVIEAVTLEWTDLFQVTGEGATVPKEKPKVVAGAPIAALRVWLDGLTPVPYSRMALDYAWKRFGLMGADTDRLGLRYASDVPGPNFVSPSFARYPRLVVPLNGFDGVTRGAQGRDLSGECPGRWLSLRNPDGQRWSPYGVFRGEAGYEPIIITEGPGDGLTAVALGYDVVAVRGAALVNNAELLEEIANGVRNRLVILAGDSDKAGQEFNRRVATGLGAHGIDVHALELPQGAGDITAWREADPEGFAGAFHAAVKAARPVESNAAHDRDRRRNAMAERTGARAVDEDDASDAVAQLRAVQDQYGEDDGNPDAVNAYAFAAWVSGRVRYAKGLGFFVWNGVTWQCDSDLLRSEIHRMGAALAVGGEAKRAKPFLMTTRIDALITELRGVPGVKVDSDLFDAKPHLLSFRNGVVDLRTGKLRPHDKDDMLTVSLPVDYEPEATAPRWEQFVAEIMPGMPEMPGYLQRLVGYGITGSTSEQCFAVLWGKGANGKSVFTETLTDVFGRITKTTPFSTFETRASGGIPNDIAALRGARLVMASEGNADKRMDEALIKRVTGKDKITARFMRQEFFTFAPTFLMWLATNHKPEFASQDEGLWRRVKLIPFTRYFAPNERDYDLDSKLRAEAAGIIAWAVRGAVEWYANGLRDPEVVTSATREYRETSDTLAGFFPGVLVADDNARMDGNDAYTAYRDWCEAEGLKQSEVWSRQRFYKAMADRGAAKRKTNKGIALTGVRPAEAGGVSGPGIFSGE